MMKNLIVLSVCILLVFASCEKNVNEPVEPEQTPLQAEEEEPQLTETPAIVSTDLLLGKWSLTSIENGIQTFNRVEEFDKEIYGLAFETAPKLIEWSFGRCATPPLHFSAYNGSYEQKDEILNLVNWRRTNVGYKILECTETQLILEQI